MATYGRTWWGERFLAALEKFTGEARLKRGRSYANNGRIIEYGIERGTVKAKVRGSINPYFGVYEEPIYDTRIAITQIEPADWSRIIARIATRADLIVKLLQQEMPDDIEEAFAEEGLHLLPHSKSDFKTSCSCPDYENPCKHIAGVYYLLARDLDRDPFVLFSMRGLARKSLQAELVKSPLGQALAASLTTEPPTIEPAASFHTRPTKQPAGKESGAAAGNGAGVSHRAFWTGARRLPPVEPVSQVRVPALVVKKQGDYPPFWHRDNSFIVAMEELYERVRTKSPQMK
jgi:uncharacterized Zn finger protein